MQALMSYTPRRVGGSRQPLTALGAYSLGAYSLGAYSLRAYSALGNRFEISVTTHCTGGLQSGGLQCLGQPI